MEQVNIKIKADTGQATKSIDNVNDSLQETSTSSKQVQADVSEMGGQLDTATGGAVSKFKGLLGTVKNVAKGFVTLKGAIISTGIGALALAIAAVVQAFKSSEEGQNKFAKIMAVIGSVVGNLTDKLSDFGELILENPLELLLTPLRSIFKRINGILMLVPSLGKAFTLLTKGEFKEAGKVAGDAFLLIATGVENATDKVKAFSDEMQADAKLAADIADRRAKADKIERDLVIDRAEADRKRAELLEKAVDRENFSTKQRIGFLKEAGELEKQITEAEIEAAKIRRDTKIEENSLSKSSKEDLEEEAALKAEVIRLETARLTKQKEVTGQIIALNNEEKAIAVAAKAAKEAEQALIDAENQKVIDAETARQDAILSIQKSFKDKQRDAEVESEIERLELEEERQLEELDRLGANEQQKLDVKAFYKGQKDKLNEDEAAKEEQLNKDVANAKLDIAKSGFALIGEIAGEGSEVGKAAALAGATISGFQGVQNAYTTAQASPVTAVFPAYPVIQAALAAGFAAVNIAKIKSAPTSGGGGAPSAPSAPSSAPPAFNVVGAAPENQLAETINANEKKPVKAFVVSTEVSNEQALARKTESQAALG